MKNFIYVRTLKHADHTIFCVTDGQKKYWDPTINRPLPYSSGQQMKRSILETFVNNLGTSLAPVIFNYTIKDDKLKQGEPWSPCNPAFADQLIGGYMKIQKNDDKSNNESINLKRRSPLSISAMRPLHPKFGKLNQESLTFARTKTEETVIITDEKGKKLSSKEVKAFLEVKGRTLNNTWLEEDKATGLFVMDLAIDLRTLFCVQLNDFEAEINSTTEKELRDKGWIESKNVFGKCLVLPKKERTKLIEALADALINWRIMTNQSRSFSLMETLAIAISDNANVIPNSIRTEIDEDDKPLLVIDTEIGGELFVAPVCKGYSKADTDKKALEKAKAYLIKEMSNFDYENQVK